MIEKSKNNIKSLIICVMTGIFIGMIIVIGKQSKEITTLKDNQIKIELKACPLCGSDEIKIKQINDVYYVRCNDCKLETDYFDTKKHASEYWNNRKNCN